MYVLNTPEFGHMLHPKRYGSLQEAADAYTDYKLKILGEHYLEVRESLYMLCLAPSQSPIHLCLEASTSQRLLNQRTMLDWML